MQLPKGSPAIRRLVGGAPFHLPVVDCGNHYGYAAQPTPVFAPWMKGRLKRPGKVLKKLFFPGYAMSSLEQANADMLACMAALGKKGQVLDSKEHGPKERLGVLPPVVSTSGGAANIYGSGSSWVCSRYSFG